MNINRTGGEALSKAQSFFKYSGVTTREPEIARGTAAHLECTVQNLPNYVVSSKLLYGASPKH